MPWGPIGPGGPGGPCTERDTIGDFIMNCTSAWVSITNQHQNSSVNGAQL